MDKVKKHWKLILSLEPVYEIYGNQILTDKDLPIDHFAHISIGAKLWVQQLEVSDGGVNEST